MRYEIRYVSDISLDGFCIHEKNHRPRSRTIAVRDENEWWGFRFSGEIKLPISNYSSADWVGYLIAISASEIILYISDATLARLDILPS